MQVCRCLCECGGWGVWRRYGDRGGGGSGAGMVESRGVCRIREIGGEGKERKRVFPSFSFIGRFVGVRSNGRECDSISINFR